MGKRREICIDETSKRGSTANSILNTCPPRKISQLIAIALADIAERYNLSEASTSDLDTFIQVYDFVRNNNSHIIPMYQANSSPSSEKVLPKEEKVEKKNNSSVTEEDKSKMATIMAMFGN